MQKAHIQTADSDPAPLFASEATRPSDPPVLTVENAVKRFGRIAALAGVSLQVRAGEFVALLGQNGAGKTTLFQLLSGLFVADGGMIRIQGHDVSRNPVPALAALGIVFQQATLDLDISVCANLRFHGGLHGLARGVEEELMTRVLAQLGLTDAASRQVRESVRRKSPAGRTRPRLDA
jgi:ABC-2 type transport system ATP-binding protein